jgi:hypothetical protein
MLIRQGIRCRAGARATLARFTPSAQCFCSDAPKITAPSGWLALKDSKTKRTYYHNTVTGSSTWTAPTEASFVPDAGGLPKGWYQLNDPETGHDFFHNQLSDDVTWTYPTEVATAERKVDSNAPMYQGALSKPIKILKRVSVTTCALTLTVMPVLLITGNPHVPLAGKLAIATVVAAAGVGTTGVHLLQVAARPCIASDILLFLFSNAEFLCQKLCPPAVSE